MVYCKFSTRALVATALLLPTAFVRPSNALGPIYDIQERSMALHNHPSHGVAYATIYADEQSRINGQTGTGRVDDVRITVRNQDEQVPIWIWAEFNNPDGRYTVLYPGRSESKIKLMPGEALEMGHFPEPSHRDPDGSKFSGAVRAYRGCDENGDNCADQLDAATKFEYAMDPFHHTNKIGINLSFVDGVSTRGEFSYGEGSDCPNYGCTVTDEEIIAVCPATHLRQVNGFVGCLSDCKVRNDYASCQADTPSSGHLSQLCSGGYAWQGDHDSHYEDCSPMGDVLISIWG